jgi:hypothetical protein
MLLGPHSESSSDVSESRESSNQGVRPGIAQFRRRDDIREGKPALVFEKLIKIVKRLGPQSFYVTQLRGRG